MSLQFLCLFQVEYTHRRSVPVTFIRRNAVFTRHLLTFVFPSKIYFHFINVADAPCQVALQVVRQYCHCSKRADERLINRAPRSVSSETGYSHRHIVYFSISAYFQVIVMQTGRIRNLFSLLERQLNQRHTYVTK